MRSFAGGVIAVAVSLATLAWAVADQQTATVTVHVPLGPVAASATLTGGRLSGQLPTQYFSTTVTETMAGRSSPYTSSTYATGYVVFVSTNPCTRLCYGEFQLPVGFDVATPSGVHYATQAEADFPLLGSSRAIPIKALVPGPGGNAAAGTVTVNGNPYLYVSNPEPVSGGASRITHVVQQQDVDATASDLTSTVAADALHVINLEDGGMRFVADALTKVKVSSDHQVGEETPAFTMTATIHLSGNAFSDRMARRLLGAKLRSELLPGQSLASWSVSTNYVMVKMTDAGDVTLAGWASGQATPSIDTDVLRELVAGKSPAQAAAIVHAWMPGSTVDVRLAPLNLPWLPSDPGRITLVVVGT